MKDLRRKFNGNKGFTLIELIVVIAILAAMAALALPTMTGLIANSKEQVAKSNARTVYSAGQAYAVTHPSSNTTLTSTDLSSMLGSGMTGDYSATISDGACESAWWNGGAGAYQATYTASDGSFATASGT
jgi:prepilin-type N-terminal cleavage/methylation domain-containing protein